MKRIKLLVLRRDLKSYEFNFFFQTSKEINNAKCITTLLHHTWLKHIRCPSTYGPTNYLIDKRKET